MKIIIADRNKELLDQFVGYNVETYHGDILDHPTDAVVSPANSFGFMDGGVDAAYLKRWSNIQVKVQAHIQSYWHFNELLVGQAFIIDTGETMIPNIIIAPTMRAPETIKDVNNIVLATRAAIDVAKRANFTRVTFPGMGTGTGRVPYMQAAMAMMKGIRLGLSPDPFPTSTLDAIVKHKVLE